MEKELLRDELGKFLPLDAPVMAASPIAVRLPIEIDAAIREMDDRSEFLREVITLAVINRQATNCK